MDRNAEISVYASNRTLGEAYRQLSAGKTRESAEIAQILVHDDPANPDVWHLMSCIYMQVGQLANASACAQRALSLAPNDPVFLIQRGRCLVAAGNRREALELAGRVTAQSLNRAEWNDALGTLLTFCEEPARALPFFRRAVDLSPADGNFLYNLATAQRMTGELQSAESSLNRVIAIRPDDSQAHHIRSSLRTQTESSNHVETLTRLLTGRRRAPQEEIPLRFALAKELEDIGRFKDSFEHLERGCNLQRSQIRYNPCGDIALMDQMIEIHDRAAIGNEVGFETDECIFVIGLPRSGTTLVERILASHSLVMAAGELQAFPSQVHKAIGAEPRTFHTAPAMYVQRMVDLDPHALGRAYIEATRPQTGKTARFVDKLPTNYLYAGLIRRALPRARIIALARGPMDSCYAMYKTLFNGAYPFSYDLTELGQYYVAWHRLMRHWGSTLGESLLIIQYEDLVTHQEAVSRQMLQHCGLAWEDTCLSFHDQKAAVTTASATQVRQAMYSSSVGKWRHFEAELQPLNAALRQQEPVGGWRLSRRCGQGAAS
jgi:tetratricopeptide (TPR) repeat protein